MIGNATIRPISNGIAQTFRSKIAPNVTNVPTVQTAVNTRSTQLISSPYSNNPVPNVIPAPNCNNTYTPNAGGTDASYFEYPGNAVSGVPGSSNPPAKSPAPDTKPETYPQT